ncbi:MAG: glycine betaine ABC transporter substrate-binding protein [Ilumatobacteraceae bacterium]
MKRTTPTARLFTRCLGPASLAMLAFAACSKDDSTTTTTLQLPPRIVVTSVKDDPASQLLATIYARVLEDGGFRVARKDPVALDRAGYYQAIQNDEFELIPDFTGDLLSFVYSQPDASPLPSTSLPAPGTTQAPVIVTTTTIPTTSTVAPADTSVTSASTADTVVVGASTTVASASSTTVAGASGFVAGAGSATTTTAAVSTTAPTDGSTTTIDASFVGDTTTSTTVPTPGNGHSVTEQVLAINAGMPSKLVVNNGSLAENKQVVACTADALAANAGTQLITLTNLASIAPNIRLGGSAEYLKDATAGFPVLERYYGGEFKDTVTVEDSGLADAIKNGDADCFAMNSLNPLITTERMTILVDDLVMTPSNAAIALMDSTVATPEAIAAIDAIAASLTTERLNQMLNEIAGGTSIVTVANAFVDTL